MKCNSILFCLLFCIAANSFTPAKAQVNVNDSLALVDFYNSTGGPNWGDNTNWLTTAPVSTWDGITVRDNRVISIRLEYIGMPGHIPASIGNLEMLETLNLGSNYYLSGAIPPEIGNLVHLTDLELYTNQLSGTIPAEIGNLVNLTLLRLDGNQLSGTIPVEIGNLVHLTGLGLNGNQLSGAIPASIGKLVNLYDLFLYENQLSGVIPAEIGNCTKLGRLYLFNNQLSGSIPASIGNLINLTNFYLFNNQLSGAIPVGIGNLVHLIYLDFNNNQLSGAIPAEIRNCKKLYSLQLENNQLSGAIPAQIGKLANLAYLDLSHNQLSGTIPTSFRRFKNLDEFDLSYNQLSQEQNVYFPIIVREITGNVSNNLFTFDGLEFIEEKYPKITYTPQANISIHQNGNTLSVYAGGTLSNNTYNWHLAGTTDSTIIKADSTFSPSQSGNYYVSVTNSVATELTLHSDTIGFTLSPLKQSSSTLIAKTVHPTTVVKHMQVYPNPAKDMVHVQVIGTAMVAISNTDGKVLLTKSINNSDVINVSSLAPGIYYLQNKTSGERQKIIVMH